APRIRGGSVRQRQRQAHQELATTARSFTARLDPTTMQPDNAAHQREADAQTALGAVTPAPDLDERVKDPPQHVRWNAHAVIAHRDLHIFSGAPRSQTDVAAAWRVLGGIVEQVRKHLREPDGIGPKPQRLRAAFHLELMAALLDQRPAGFDSGE